MKIIFKIQMIIDSIKKRGLIGTIKFIFTEFSYDLFNNVDTSDVVNLKNLTLSSDYNYSCCEYWPTNPNLMKIIFEYLKSKYELSNMGFIDFGSGKGRILIYASKYSFKKIIGVEFAKELCLVSLKNLKVLGIKDIKVINEDARKYAIEDDINIFYFFNPFLEDIMSIVLENIESSFYKNKRQIVIVYVNPICKDIFSQNDNYHISYNMGDEFIIYERDI